jgi:hypothetical protein
MRPSKSGAPRANQSKYAREQPQLVTMAAMLRKRGVPRNRIEHALCEGFKVSQTRARSAIKAAYHDWSVNSSPNLGRGWLAH